MSEDSVPTSNIDDVQITLNDSDHIENHHSMDNQHNEIILSQDRVTEPSKPAISPIRPAIKHRGSHDSINSGRLGPQQPYGEAVRRSNAAAPTAPAAPPATASAPVQELVQTNKKPADNCQSNGHTADKHPDPKLLVDEDRSPDRKRASLTPSVTYANSTPPSGTLADLKKQRAQQQMRNRDSDKYRNSISEDSSLGNSVYPPSERNGHSPGLTDSRSNSLTYLPDDRPKHRFTATNTEIIGGEDNKTNCCIIL